MDEFYRGIETSLLALSLALGIAVTALSAAPRSLPEAQASTTLPMIEVFASGEAE